MLSIFSPLEQFRCLPLITVDIGHFTVTVCSNITAAAFLCFSFFLFFFYYFSNIKKKVLYVVPTRIQLIFEFCFFMVYDLIKANVGPSALPFFPYIFTFFLFTISSNVTGLAPYGYTITSHIIITFSLAIWFFFGVTIINYKRNQKNVGQIFLPPESALILAFLLVPIELVSFLFRP
jgi:F-type H+-transporting ATPase subunit a